MKQTVLGIGFFILIISCHKSHNSNSIQFPVETQSGLNTLGCYIDGQAFIPSTTLYGNVIPIDVFYSHVSTPYYKAGFLSIQGIDARYSLNFAGNVVIQKLQVFGTGEYPLSHVFNCPNPYDCDGGGYYNAKENKTYFIESGKLTITKLDTLNMIISGKFYFMSKDTLGNTKEITAGIFDAKYTN